MSLQHTKLSALACIVGLVVLLQHGASRPIYPEAVTAQQSSAVGKPSSEADMIDALDRAIQKRFHSVIGFGMARIATEKKFTPETEEEKEAVNSLNKANLKVGLYLAGRGVLNPKPTKSQFSFGLARSISPPIFVGSMTNVKELPAPFDLWEQTQKALTAFGEGKDSYEFKMDKWIIAARPVRAGDQSCLQCHKEDFTLIVLPNGTMTGESKGNKLQVGDPLGVLLYAYSPSR